MNTDVYNGKNLSTVLTEMKEEFTDFVETRLAILKAELNEKLAMLKAAGPLAAIAVVFLGTAYLLFTLALVGLVLAFFEGNPYRWCFAFLSVAILWTIVGAIAAYSARQRLQQEGLLPKKTIGVLKGDKIWIQSEVNNSL